MLDYKDIAKDNIEKIENELEELNLPPQHLPSAVAAPRTAARIVREWSDRQPSNVLIVTRHDGLCDWLIGRGIIARRIEHATAEDVRGEIVIGPLPPVLAAEARININIELTLTPEMRGCELTAADVEEANPTATAYYTMNLGDGRCRNPRSKLHWEVIGKIVRGIIYKINKAAGSL